MCVWFFFFLFFLPPTGSSSWDKRSRSWRNWRTRTPSWFEKRWRRFKQKELSSWLPFLNRGPTDWTGPGRAGLSLQSWRTKNKKKMLRKIKLKKKKRLTKGHAVPLHKAPRFIHRFIVVHTLLFIESINSNTNTIGRHAGESSGFKKKCFFRMIWEGTPLNKRRIHSLCNCRPAPSLAGSPFRIFHNPVSQRAHASVVDSDRVYLS